MFLSKWAICRFQQLIFQRFVSFIHLQPSWKNYSELMKGCHDPSCRTVSSQFCMILGIQTANPASLKGVSLVFRQAAKGVPIGSFFEDALSRVLLKVVVLYVRFIYSVEILLTINM